MKEFWDQRYGGNEYVYGTSPNQFFKAFVDKNPPGNILLPAEGEGRNAVYAAMKNWNVYAFDQSENGKNKALELARKHNVEISYELADAFDFYYTENHYDYIGIFYFHIERAFRNPFFDLIVRALKPGGKVVLEVFSTIMNKGIMCGPPNIELRYEQEEIEEYFSSLDFSLSEQKDVLLEEGDYHRGDANIIRLIAEKK